MKKILILIAAVLFFNSARANDSITKADDISYEWLVQYGQQTGMGEHVRHFRKIFGLTKVKNLLEFGMGFSTKYFLDHCNKVISVEFITDGSGPEWMRKFIHLYRDCPNWIPIAYFSAHYGDTTFARYKYLGSESLSKAAYYQTVNHKSYAAINDFYLVEMNAFIVNLLKSHKIDIALVDPGTFIRGDIVQLLFDKISIILAHHTGCRAAGMKDDVYGYSRIETPPNYQEIYLPGGLGTTVWVKKEEKLKSLIEALMTYAQNPN